MATATQLITAEEYANMPDMGVPTELVRGEIIESGITTPRHGQVCHKAAFLLYDFTEAHCTGHTVCNNAGIITERNPDTVRGGDIWFISYGKIPKGPLPQDYLEVAPEIVIEVKSVFDRWSKLLGKVAEYLDAGVAVVCPRPGNRGSAVVLRGESRGRP